ncbi:hypothetical protein [Pseudodesulfovibrio sp.]|uniref:hypothetical protein n=1 Tax=Pseudodesulfovibrio sp. TaxID=2035812 RepID=UPI00262FC152|nr:hypothetical protein [Pseudodesulfovibrio sp.]MDD3312510.1 hypothetical protein [Pseudodesulfovibrio sp.]
MAGYDTTRVFERESCFRYSQPGAAEGIFRTARKPGPGLPPGAISGIRSAAVEYNGAEELQPKRISRCLLRRHWIALSIAKTNSSEDFMKNFILVAMLLAFLVGCASKTTTETDEQKRARDAEVVKDIGSRATQPTTQRP